MARRQREDEKSARGKRRRLSFAAARRGLDRRKRRFVESVRRGKYFYKVQKRYGAAHGRCASKGRGKSNVDETREKKIPMERGQGTREQVNGCKKQVLRNLPQIAASCSRLQQVAASCSRLQQVAAGCNRLRLESESNPNLNPNPNPNRSRESNPSCFPKGQQGSARGRIFFSERKDKGK